jgi:Sulfatase
MVSRAIMKPTMRHRVIRRNVLRVTDRKKGVSMNTKRKASLALLTLLASAFVVTPEASAQQPKPNILFIMGDDIGWMQLGSYQQGMGLGETPNLDRIANEGAKFVTYYAEQSCTAGRNAFFTGMNPLRTGMIPPQLPGSPSYLRPVPDLTIST